MVAVLIYSLSNLAHTHCQACRGNPLLMSLLCALLLFWCLVLDIQDLHLVDVSCNDSLPPPPPNPCVGFTRLPLPSSVYLLLQLQHRLLHLGELLAIGAASPGFHLVLGLLLMSWERREA